MRIVQPGEMLDPVEDAPRWELPDGWRWVELNEEVTRGDLYACDSGLLSSALNFVPCQKRFFYLRKI